MYELMQAAIKVYRASTDQEQKRFVGEVIFYAYGAHYGINTEQWSRDESNIDRICENQTRGPVQFAGSMGFKSRY